MKWLKNGARKGFMQLYNCMKPFLAPFFNHFMYFISPPIAKLKYLHGFLMGQLTP